MGDCTAIEGANILAVQAAQQAQNVYNLDNAWVRNLCLKMNSDRLQMTTNPLFVSRLPERGTTPSGLTTTSLFYKSPICFGRLGAQWVSSTPTEFFSTIKQISNLQYCDFRIQGPSKIHDVWRIGMVVH